MQKITRLRAKIVGAALLMALMPGLGLGLIGAAEAQTAAPPVARTNNTVAQELLRLVNAERQRVNAPPLVLNANLAIAAQRHSQDMATHRRMSHTGSDGSTMQSRIEATQYNWSTIGENVAMGQPTAAAVITAWMNSPGHRRNILNPAFTELGVGYAQGGGRPYWTQVFARPQ